MSPWLSAPEVHNVGQTGTVRRAANDVNPMLRVVNHPDKDGYMPSTIFESTTDIRSWEDCAQELGRIERKRNFRLLPQNATNRAHCSRSYPGMDSTGVIEARLPRVPSSVALLEHVLCMDLSFICIICLRADQLFSDQE